MTSITFSSSRAALAGLALAVLLPALGSSSAQVGLPTLVQAFAAPFQQVQWVVLAYLLVITSVIVGAGRLGDLLGRRRLLLAGIALFALASLLCGLAPTLGLLIAARAAQGLGAAFMMALAMALVGETVPKARLGSAMGLLGTVSAVGTALGPTLGGLLIAGAGWRWIFLVNLPPAALAFWLVRRYLPGYRAGAGQASGFDYAGTALLAGSLLAYALAMTWGGGRWGVANLALLLAALAGLAALLRVERRAAAPLLRPELLADPLLATRLVMSALVSTVVMATLVVGPFYLAGTLGLDAARLGLVLSCGPLAAALSGWPAGRLVDRLGAPRVSLAGLSAMAAGCLLLALLPQALGVAGYVLPLMLLTGGYGLFQTANNTAVMAGVAAEQRGLVSGLSNLSRYLGLITGASAMGALFAFVAAPAGRAGLAAAPAAAIAAGMHATFALAALLVLAALAAAWAGRRLGARRLAT